MQQMYDASDLAAMDPLVLMKNLDHVRMTSRRLSYILQQQVHLYTPEANQLREQIDRYVEANARSRARWRAARSAPDQEREEGSRDPRLTDGARRVAGTAPEPSLGRRGPKPEFAIRSSRGTLGRFRAG